MADILIRGMEMPHDCPHCWFAAIGFVSPMSSDCTLYCRAVDKFKDCATAVLEDKPYEVINRYNDRPDWCPLVPLPEGHGDLIDRDNVLLDIDCTGTNKFGMLDEDIRAFLRRYKPIVPAEGGKADGN